MLSSLLLFAIPIRESRLSINDLSDCCNPCKDLSGSGKKLPWILSWVSENSVRIQFHLGNCGSTDQSSSFYTSQDNLLQTATSRVVYGDNSMCRMECLVGAHKTLISCATMSSKCIK
jgi:hypothetical protein